MRNNELGLRRVFNIGVDGHPAVGLSHHMDTPMLHVDVAGLSQPDVAVDAAARVPARVGLVAVVDTHGHHVVALMHVGRDIVLEAGVTVGPVAHLLSVHVDGAVHVHAVKLEEKPFWCAVTLWQRERLTVPPYSTRQRTTAGTAGIAFVEVALDGPVVRHVQ